MKKMSYQWFRKKINIIVSISIVAILVLSVFTVYLVNESKRIKKEKQQDLQVITKFKTDQLARWHQERIGDASVLSKRIHFIERVEQWLHNKENEAAYRGIIEELNNLKNAYTYEAVILSSVNGELLLASGYQQETLSAVTINEVIKAVNQRQIRDTDFYRCPLEDKIHHDNIIPLINKAKKPVAALILRTDPDIFIFPLLEFQSYPAESFETLIVRQEGDSVVFLNELRYWKNTALRLRISLSREAVPAVQAVLGYQGIWEGRDYRDKNVVAALKPVANTPWFLIAKIDKNELYQELYNEFIYLSIFFILIVLILGLIGLFIYFHQQRNVYKRLWQAHSEFKTTLYSIGDGVITTDTSGCVKYMNPVAQRLTGWKESRARGKAIEKVFNIINEETRSKVTNPVKQVLDGGLIVGLANNTLLISKTGKEIPIADSGAPIKNEKNQTIGVVLVFRDQTKERVAQKALRDSEDRLKYIFESANVGKSVTLPSGEINVNKAFADMLGYTVAELKDTTWQELTPAEEIPGTQKKIEKLLIGKKDSLRFDKRYIHKNGDYIWTDVSVTLRRDRAGKPLYFITTVVDITERKQAEEKLKSNYALLRIAGETARFGGWSVDLEKNICTWSDAVADIHEMPHGYAPPLEEGINFYAPEWRDKITQVFIACTEKGIPYDEEMEIITKKGNRLWVRTIGRAVKDENGRIIKVQGSFQDITKRKKAEEALHCIKWMLSKKTTEVKSDPVPSYGDLTELNTSRLILDSVGKNVLKDIADDFLRLLDTSYAIYEKNGDYVLGIFASGWCRFMDQASRELCDTDDNKEALNCGKWLCHESCWKEASLPAIESGRPVDIECQGGIHLYALPIVAGDEVIGAINFGYGDPPQDKEKLSELAEKYKVPLNELEKKASEYETRPSFIIDTAKERLQAAANLIGEIVSRKTKEKEIIKLNEQLEQKVAEKTKDLKERVAELERFHDATIQREFRIKELRDEIDRLKGETG